MINFETSSESSAGVMDKHIVGGIVFCNYTFLIVQGNGSMVPDKALFFNQKVLIFLLFMKTYVVGTL